LGGAEQATGATQVEDLGGTAEDGGEQVGGAGQPAGLAGGDRRVADQSGAEAVAQPVVVDRDHEGGGITAVQRQPLRVHRFQERGEGVAQLLVVGAAVARR
jgi:hypothetical protein